MMVEDDFLTERSYISLYTNLVYSKNLNAKLDSLRSV